MRELSMDEMEVVAGGDGLRLPGNNYISGVNGPTKFLGVGGALTSSFSAGYAVGTALNSYFGWSNSLGRYAYEKDWGDIS